VIISNNVIIRDNNSHPVQPQKRIELCKSGFNSNLWEWEHSISKPIRIYDNVWIGERVIIYKGVEIGEGSIVAGGSVVVKSVPEYTIVAGNPAKVVKYLLRPDSSRG
jgi:maltose O-acetyltransferase